MSMNPDVSVFFPSKVTAGSEVGNASVASLTVSHVDESHGTQSIESSRTHVDFVPSKQPGVDV